MSESSLVMSGEINTGSAISERRVFQGVRLTSRFDPIRKRILYEARISFDDKEFMLILKGKNPTRIGHILPADDYTEIMTIGRKKGGRLEIVEVELFPPTGNGHHAFHVISQNGSTAHSNSAEQPEKPVPPSQEIIEIRTDTPILLGSLFMHGMQGESLETGDKFLVTIRERFGSHPVSAVALQKVKGKKPI